MVLDVDQRQWRCSSSRAAVVMYVVISERNSRLCKKDLFSEFGNQFENIQIFKDVELTKLKVTGPQ
jgi:hypothetical protein